MTQKKVFVLGDRDAVLGFSLLGIEGLATDDPAMARARLSRLRQDPTIGLILVTAGLARRIEPELEALRAAAGLPIVYEIPDRRGPPERPPLGDVLRRALGVRI